MILDVITSSPPLQLIITFVCVGLAYLYYRNSSPPPPSIGGSSAHSHSSSVISNPSGGAQNLLANRDRNHYSHNLSSLQSYLQEQEDLHQTIARIERQERDMIRQEQDEAYKKSLEADREKQRKRKEEEKRREEQERERQRQIIERELLLELKQSIHTKLPPELIESKNDSAKRTLRLVIKLPNGTRIARRFSLDEPVKHLYWFVFGHEAAPLRFKITTNFPRREIPGRSPLPEDFPDLKKSESICENNFHMNKSDITKECTPNTHSVSNSPSSPVCSTVNGAKSDTDSIKSVSDKSEIEPNCELSFKEAGITQSEMLFVYDLEA